MFGVLTFLEAPNVDKNLPTPFIGLWERINIAAFMIWLLVFATILLRAEKNCAIKEQIFSKQYSAIKETV